jgi:ribosome-associated toxin RatA of RatAB toxin-antitoxin module
MADESTQSITIAAPADAVMAVIADFAQYPVWAASVKKVDVLETYPDGRGKRVAFAIDAAMARDEYELSYEWTGDQRVDWTLTSSTMQRSQRGSYALSESGEGTDVTYSLLVELKMPMLGLLKRKLEKVVMDTALKELKKRVESITS